MIRKTGERPPRIAAQSATTTRARSASTVRSLGAEAPAPAATNGRTRASRPPAVLEAEIAERAYHLYLSRGGGHGADVDDWLRAERELRDSATIAS